MRKKTNTVRVGDLAIGGDSPITVQSMTTMPPSDIDATTEQIDRLTEAGCEIVRVAVPDMESADAIAEIKRRRKVNLVADIHFDYRLAIASVRAGADKIRINPGNIGSLDRVKAVVDVCTERGIPIRVGVNSGSVEKDLLAHFGGPTPEALAESALRNAAVIADMGFENLVLSLKSSSVADTVAAYEYVAERCTYPLHLGVTHAGGERMGTVKSAIGIGALLLKGIGDTVRVSLTGDPVSEVRAARDILAAAGARTYGPEVISCPTCGRCRIDVISLAEQVEEAVSDTKKPLKIAVMGCAVNGPGEARECDIGIAGGSGEAVLFRKGEIVKKIPEDKLLETIVGEVKRMQ